MVVSNKFSSDGVDVYDTLHNIPEADGSVAQQVSCILCCPHKSFNLNLINVQCQEGLDDCGGFALAIAYDLCAERVPFNAAFDQTKMRPHILSCFGHGSITGFPRLKQASRKQRVLQTVEVKVYCSCRQPENS